PDLEVSEFAGQIRMMYPAVELMGMDGGVDGRVRSPRRNELLHALREAQGTPLSDTAAWKAAPVAVPSGARLVIGEVKAFVGQQTVMTLPEMVGESEPMVELARLIRLVAPRSTTV